MKGRKEERNRGEKVGEGKGGGGGRSGEEETVLPLMSSLSSAGDRLLAPKI